MQVNILKALEAQEILNQELYRLSGYINKEPEGELKNILSALLKTLESTRAGVNEKITAAIVDLSDDAGKYIKAEEVEKQAQPK